MNDPAPHTPPPTPNLPVPAGGLTREDAESLAWAHQHLEHASLAARWTSRLGKPVEKLFGVLPKPVSDGVHRAVRANLERTLNVAIHSLGKDRPIKPARGYHKYLGMMSGAAGGFFGLPAVLAELPVSSAIMLRAIASIARAEGEDLSDPEARLACMEVFALGGGSQNDDAAETGYYGVRIALGLHFSSISPRVAAQGIVKWNPPFLVRFLAEIAARFGVVVTQKAAAQMVPVLGAGTGALVNRVFIEHFEDIARAHFTMRRLERSYGMGLIREEYRRLGVAGMAEIGR